MYGKDPEKVLFSRKEAAEYLSISPNTLAVWASTGRYALPYTKIGNAVRYTRADLNNFIEQRLAYKA